MRIAAVLYEKLEGAEVDALLGELAGRLRERGLNLAGAVQSNPPVEGRSRCDMVLEDLASGRHVKASEDRGALAAGCRLDEGALEGCVGLAAASLDSATDLVIVNRFGKCEAGGRGFRPVIEQAVLLDTPVLVGLNRAHLESWCAFLGETPVLLSPTRDALVRWCTAVLGERGPTLAHEGAANLETA